MASSESEPRIPMLQAIQPLVDQATAELRAKTGALNALLKFDEATWSIDQDMGLIEFERQDGIRSSAPVQIIGTYNTADGTWLWAWDNPSIEQPLRKDSQALLEYGRTHGVAALTTRKLQCREQDCWDFAALACKLCDRQGAYRGPAGQTPVFTTFGEVRMLKDPAHTSSH